MGTSIHIWKSEAGCGFCERFSILNTEISKKWIQSLDGQKTIQKSGDRKQGTYTYGYLTLIKAIQDCRDVYQPFSLNPIGRSIKGSKKPRKH